MRTTKMALIAAALTLPLSIQAQAADAIAETPPAPPVADIATAPAYLWAGGYAGVFGGYSWGEYETQPDAGADGTLGGIYGGYNWQSENIVYGVEADVGVSGSAEQSVIGSLRARLGYDMNPFLLYATGGLAAAKNEMTTGLGEADETMVGWTAGAGIEAFVTDRITTRVEYRYSDYGTGDFDFGGTNVSSGFDDHSVRVGIGYKF